MFAKLQITGVLEIKTGLHIGGSSAFAAIGAVDAPVIKDVKTNQPMIPGSSLKGKMRTLLAKQYNKAVVTNPDDDAECLTRLFGSSKKGKVQTSRVLVSDMFLLNEEELRSYGIQSLTEVKFENTINRANAIANPRQIERVIRGSQFGMDIVYEVENGHEDEVLEDMEVFTNGLKLLQYDYLGGNGSRGYGKVVFKNLVAEVVIGEVDDSILDKCNELLSEVSK